MIGVFFQIVTLQKVGQVGAPKAMGASTGLIVRSALAQMVLVTAVGVGVGALVALGLASAIPPTVPLSWPAQAIALTVLSLLVMGPLGGLISVRISAEGRATDGARPREVGVLDGQRTSNPRDQICVQDL